MKVNIKQLLPGLFRQQLHIIKRRYKLITVRKSHKKALKRIQDKERLNCVFFALFEEVWKYDDVYKLMKKDELHFNPIILVCPMISYGYESMVKKMDKCYSFFKEKGYNVIRAYNTETDSYVDVRKELEPDIIFYTNPYKSLIDNRYFINNFQDVLTVYVPYFINSNKDYAMACNCELHNQVWRRYSETEYHKELSVKYADNKGRNVVNSGYPGIEPFLLNKPYVKTHSKKLIIWAPHHTIEPIGIIYYSCFLKYYEFMLEMANKYAEQVFFVFKPHPLLRDKLNKKWGKEKTDNYYKEWVIRENTSLNESDYVELFIESDAMIHDSASFIAEYLYLNKPVMRTMNGEDLETMYNSFGLQCINNHYHAYKEEDIEDFIISVINGEDSMKDQRSAFVRNELLPHGSPSQNIIDDIRESIKNQIVYWK